MEGVRLVLALGFVIGGWSWSISWGSMNNWGSMSYMVDWGRVDKWSCMVDRDNGGGMDSMMDGSMVGHWNNWSMMSNRVGDGVAKVGGRVTQKRGGMTKTMVDNGRSTIGETNQSTSKRKSLETKHIIDKEHQIGRS